MKSEQVGKGHQPDKDSVEASRGSPSSMHQICAAGGLTITALGSGCIRAIELGNLLINQVLASPLGGGIHALYLRILDGREIRFHQIVGAHARSRFFAAEGHFLWTGRWDDLEYRCVCRLHPADNVWFFDVEVRNRSAHAVRYDVVLLQDVGLANSGQVRNNERFTSQYLDHLAIPHRHIGTVVMTRQNLPQAAEIHPWLVQGCMPAAKGFCTDGFDFFGVGHKDGSAPAALRRPVIGSQVRQYEAAYIAIQSAEASLKADAAANWTFFGAVTKHHPARSSETDLSRVDEVVALHRAMPPLRDLPDARQTDAPRSIFTSAALLPADEFSNADVNARFPGLRRHEESEGGRLLSFFCGDNSRHVVLRAKELAVERPHAHILRAGQGLLPDDELMACACFAAGVFASQLTLGNSNLGKLVSSVRDPLNIIRSSGVRVFVREDASAPWRLLGIPSALEMSAGRCRWHYKSGTLALVVCCGASEADPAICMDIFAESGPLEMLICGELSPGSLASPNLTLAALDRRRMRFTARPHADSLLGRRQPKLVCHVVTPDREKLAAAGGDELLFPTGGGAGVPLFVYQTRSTRSFRLAIVGTIADTSRADSLAESFEDPTSSAWQPSESNNGFWSELTAGMRISSRAAEQTSQLQDSLTWFARDAVVHLSAPRGIEQPNGGAWGVRDVCQGPVEFLLSYNHSTIVADILRRLFAQQYDGRFDWPQWFMFPPFQEIQSTHAHGDVIIWPLKALCDYLEHTNDGSILQEQLPYTDDKTFARTSRVESVLEHVDRLIDRIRRDFVPGLALPRFGDGDWDDSLQPADPMLRERMVSSWTTELLYQTLQRYGTALAHFGEDARAHAVHSMSAKIRDDFQRHLVPDGVVAGFAIFEGSPPRPVEYLLHPSDRRTGLRYRLIPMSRGVLSGLFTPAQAEQHLGLINRHLLFPDGARLMDRPAEYAGGLERTFRRCESAAFFGREIGLQYVHAHLRYAEALSAMGRADELWRALLVVNPISVTDVVPHGRMRQRNCYFSSSDADFKDRYEASRSYDQLRRGNVATDGGWRIYSSGPGIYTSLVLRHLLGLRRHFDCVEFDPVLPRDLDGLTCEQLHEGRNVRYEFAVRQGSFSPRRIVVNGRELDCVQTVAGIYRAGGVRVPRAAFLGALNSPKNSVRIEI